MKCKIIIFLLFPFFLLTTYKIISQQNNDSKKLTSIIVMPFVQEAHYPYSIDEFRFSLVNSFLRRDFEIVEDTYSWSKVLKLDWRLYDINEDMADSICAVSNADLLVYGRIDILSGKFRSIGLYTSFYSPTPILIKVYDHKKKDIVLYERMEFIQRDGLAVTNLDITDIADQIAIKLKELGY